MKKRLSFTRKKHLSSVGCALDALVAAHGGKTRRHLNALWEHWEHVMGPEITALGQPLGHHKTALLIGVENSMVMQELTMLVLEILERANTFMDEDYFTEVKGSLLQGRQVLTEKREQMTSAVPEKAPFNPPPNLGDLAEQEYANFYYGKYYQAYVSAVGVKKG